jgi:hypothetical protein
MMLTRWSPTTFFATIDVPTPAQGSRVGLDLHPFAAARSRLLILCVSLVASLFLHAPGTHAQAANNQGPTPTDSVGLVAEAPIGEAASELVDDANGDPAAPRIGIGGIFRVGCWTGLHWGNEISASDVAIVETLDPDGVRARFLQSGISGSSDGARPSKGPDPGPNSRWAYVVPGSSAAPLKVMNDSGATVWSGRFGGQAIEPGVPWIVIIGDSMGIDEIGKNDLLGRGASVAVAKIGRAQELPDRLPGWEGVDQVVISASGLDVLQAIDPWRAAALAGWVSGGGRLLISLGEEGAAMIDAAPWLADLAGIAPGLTDTELPLDPAALETYTAAQTRLDDINGYPLPASGGKTLIAGRSKSRRPARLAIERLQGLGRVCVTSFGLDSPEFAEWPERMTLLTRLQPLLLEGNPQSRREVLGKTSVPYDDLAGQLRAALDRFDSQTRLPFSITSLILLLLVALVGPIDYLVVNRLLGKPLLGWLTFPLTVLALSALLLGLGMRRADGDASAKIARIEIVDIGGVEGTGGLNGTDGLKEPGGLKEPVGRPTARLIAVTHTAAPQATKLDLPANLSATWASMVGPEPPVASPSAKGTSPAAANGDLAARIVTPSVAPVVTSGLTRSQGYSGPTYGGILIAGENRSLPPYDVPLDSHPGDTWAMLAGGPREFPIPPGGSKSWLTRLRFAPRLGTTTGLAQRRGSELLSGSITNPLQVDLLDAVLVYGNWCYLLPTRFRAGQTIASIDSLRQKNFRWHLSKREIADNASKLAPWDVEMHDDWMRLTEILMFESSAGGRDYTGLEHRPLRELDLTYALAFGDAILYGRLAEPILESPLKQERPTVSVARILLPVAPAQESP